MYIDFCTNFDYSVLMSPKSNKSGIKSFRPVLSEPARDSLTELAAGLGFIVSAPSLYTGKPSVPDLLEALAACYVADLDGTRRALKALLVANDLLPDSDAPDPVTE